jgi:hypothetical protein
MRLMGLRAQFEKFLVIFDEEIKLIRVLWQDS